MPNIYFKNLVQLNGGKAEVRLQNQNAENIELFKFRTKKNFTSFKFHRYSENTMQSHTAYCCSSCVLNFFVVAACFFKA